VEHPLVVGRRSRPVLGKETVGRKFAEMNSLGRGAIPAEVLPTVGADFAVCCWHFHCTVNPQVPCGRHPYTSS